MKKIVLLFTIILLLSACGKDNEPTPEPKNMEFYNAVWALKCEYQMITTFDTLKIHQDGNITSAMKRPLEKGKWTQNKDTLSVDYTTNSYDMKLKLVYYTDSIKGVLGRIFYANISGISFTNYSFDGNGINGYRIADF